MTKSSFDTDVLLLRPTTGEVDVNAVEHRLAATPGAFRDPIRPATWILSLHPGEIDDLRSARIGHPHEWPLEVARVTPSSSCVEVIPDYSTGRARQFVTWLLGQGDWTLEVGGEAIGPAREPSDIYADDTWQDPDASADPTENPPRAGFVVVLNRYREVSGDSLSEELVVHSSGIMSYLQLHPIEDDAKTYRRLTPELLQRWLQMLRPLLAGQADQSEPPDGRYVDPVFFAVEAPTANLSHGIAKLDAANPPPQYRELISLTNGWATAMRADRTAIPPGLLPYPS
jgi:hypothetical protein